jgi:hypothetical protein
MQSAKSNGPVLGEAACDGRAAMPGRRWFLMRDTAAATGLAVRRARLAAAALCIAVVACTGAPVAPTTWLRLPDVAPGGEASAAAAAGSPAAAAVSAAGASPVPPRDTWQLMQPIALPAHLERDSVFVPQGAAGAWVRPLAGARWIEPLRDAVPRLLREDLVRAAGGRALWTAPLPPGLVPTRQLRVEITAFEVGGDGRALLTAARWSLADARGAQLPALHAARFETPATNTEAEGWALAHRQAITTLAARVAATMAAP